MISDWVMPRLVAIEGVDGSLKTTLVQSLAHELGNRDVKVAVTREPGALLAVRSLVKHPPVPLHRREEYMLFMADRLFHLRTFVDPLSASGTWVISDRYHWSSLVYQGMGATEEELAWMYDVAFGMIPEAALTVWLSCDPEEAYARTQLRNDGQPDPFDRLDTIKRAHRAYETLYRQSSSGHKIKIDTTHGLTADLVLNVADSILSLESVPGFQA